MTNTENKAMERETAGSPDATCSGALPQHEEENEREARIAADVFDPAESDLDYFLRRKRLLEEKRQNSMICGQKP